MQHSTDDVAIATAYFRSDCPCRVTTLVSRGERFPKCAKCKRVVGWELERMAPNKPPTKAEAKEG